MTNEHEPITKGLRELMSYQSLVGTDTFKSRVAADPDAFDAACDDIDAIHRSLEQENERLRNASERGDDWIKPPLDADGVAWNIGDRDENGYEVTSLKLTKSGLFYFADGMPNDAGEHRHYHHDTWQRIIEDAMKLGYTDPDNEHLEQKLVARCKALCERTREGEE